MIFWGLAILPVYELAVLGDVVILNTIEFWTGNKLIGDAGAAESDTALAANTTITETEDGSLRITRGDDVFVVMAESADRVRVVKNGVVVGFAERQLDGSVVASDENGDVKSVASAADVDAGLDAAAAAIR